MKNLLTSFRTNVSGAVTVEWVVLTAAVVGIAIAVLVAIAPGIGNLADKNANVLTPNK